MFTDRWVNLGVNTENGCDPAPQAGSFVKHPENSISWWLAPLEATARERPGTGVAITVPQSC